MSPLPRPCSAETNFGSPSPKFHNPCASASSFAPSTLFAASTTFFLDLRSKVNRDSSSSRAPTWASITKRTRSLSAIAASDPAVIFWEIPSGLTSQPPVSIKIKRRPFHSASYLTRSRVTPGVSSTIASLRPIIRFTRVDFPTFGRPITAIFGRPSKFLRFNHSQIISTTSFNPISVESNSRASSAGRSGEILRVLSIRSRLSNDLATFSVASLASISVARRSALACKSAYRKTLRFASGATTVPISRPSTTIPVSHSSIIVFCISTKCARNSGI